MLEVVARGRFFVSGQVVSRGQPTTEHVHVKCSARGVPPHLLIDTTATLLHGIAESEALAEQCSEDLCYNSLYCISASHSSDLMQPSATAHQGCLRLQHTSENALS